MFKLNERGVIAQSLVLLLLVVGLAVGTYLVQQKTNYKSKAQGSIATTSQSSSSTVKDLMGVNVVVNDSTADIARVVGWVRDYHKWYWYEATDNTHTWSYSWQRLDRFYSQLKSSGVDILVDVELAPAWASSNGKIDGVPNAAKHAEYLGALAKHYGGTIAAIENYNEPNQWWMPVKFPADQFGAMTALDYTAVKAAYPQTLLVYAGLAGPDTNYMKNAKPKSGDKYDVLNFHWYGEGNTITGGRNPEGGGLLGQISTMKSWRDANAPGKPIWITEFGWDTGVGTGKFAGKISKTYAEPLKAANYLVRAFLMMQANGVEKGFVYNYRDVTPSDNQAYWWVLYNTSGLVQANNPPVNGAIDGFKKPGWYYLATLKNTLGDYSYSKTVSEGQNIYHYEYVKPGTNQKAAVLWARNGDRDNGYTINYKNAPSGKLIEFADKSETGTQKTTNGAITLTEKPVIILYEAAPDIKESSANPIVEKIKNIISIPTSIPASITTPIPTSNPTSVPTPTPASTSDSSIPSTSLNLLDGGFEKDLNSNWDLPTWFTSIISTSNTNARSGSSALRFQGKGAAYISQDVDASPKQEVKLSGWVNMTEKKGSSNLLITLVARGSRNNDLKDFKIYSLGDKTSGWTRFEGTATMPINTETVRVKISAPYLNGTIYLDDISF